MSIRLASVEREYQDTLHGDMNRTERDRRLSRLMATMQREFGIPLLHDVEFERGNRSVIAMYRKLSISRTFEE